MSVAVNQTISMWWDSLLHRLDQQGGAAAHAADKLRSMSAPERSAVINMLSQMAGE